MWELMEWGKPAGGLDPGGFFHIGRFDMDNWKNSEWFKAWLETSPSPSAEKQCPALEANGKGRISGRPCQGDCRRERLPWREYSAVGLAVTEAAAAKWHSRN